MSFYGGTQSLGCSLVEAKGWCQMSCSETLSTPVLYDRVSHWTCNLAGGHQDPEILLSPYPTVLGLQVCMATLSFFRGHWGLELRSSDLQRKYSYPLSHLSIPTLAHIFLYENHFIDKLEYRFELCLGETIVLGRSVCVDCSKTTNRIWSWFR